MLKKIVICLFCVLPFVAFAQDIKFGHIDRQELLKDMPEAIEAQKSLEDLVLKYKEETTKLETEFQTKFADFQQNPPTDPAIKTSKENELNRMYENIQTFATSAQENLQKKQMELMLPLEEKINKAIQQVGDENKFIYIFDMQAQAILYHSSQSTDVLPLVKKKLNLK